MKRNIDLLSLESCEKYLRPFLYVMDEPDPRGLLDIAMASKYWSAFFVKTFTAWAGTQGNTKHHFDRCMLKTTSGNLPRFEINSLKIWKYHFIPRHKCHEFRCNGCEEKIRFERCNSFDSAHLLMTVMRQHMGMKLPANPYVAHLQEINTPASMKPCCKLKGMANMQYMLFRMMTYVEKAHCARVKLYYDKLVLHHKAILKGDLNTETVTARGGHEMPRRVAKDNLAVDKEIALVDNWGWKGRPNPKPVSACQQKEKWAQSDVREA
eukprot:scaffold83123_cov48-Attheya_sp.AAC.1